MTSPFGNLSWAPHHHAATLLALVLAWHLARPTRGSYFRGRLAVTGLLLAAILVTSIYVGLVVLLALFLLYVVPRWRQTWDGGAWLRATGAFGGAVALGLILASGMLVEMSRGVPADRARMRPTVPHNFELLEALADLGNPRAAPSVLGSPAPPADPEGLPYLGRVLAAIVLGFLGLPFQFGLVGILGVIGLVRRRGWQSLPPPVVALAVSAAVCCLGISNFDLQLRSSATLWLLLGFGVALFWGTPGVLRGLPERILVTLACLVGLASLAFSVEGVSRPVFFDARDVEVMTWAKHGTPPRAIVQAFPGTSPRIAYVPRRRSFATASYSEFTGRCALLGGSLTMRYLERPEVLAEHETRLAQAFEAPGAPEAAARFAAEGVDYVLWTSGDESAPWSAAKAKLLDSRYFEMMVRRDPALIVRVRR